MAISPFLNSALRYSGGSFSGNLDLSSYASQLIQPGTSYFGNSGGVLGSQLQAGINLASGNLDYSSAASLFGALTSSVDLGPFSGFLTTFGGLFSGQGPQQGSPGFLFPPAQINGSGLQYPGAGDEPEAQYGGYVYNTRAPVVFSITRAQAKAKTESVWDMMGQDSLMNWNELPSFNSDWYKKTGISSTLPQDLGSVQSFSGAGVSKIGAMSGFTDNGLNLYSKYGGKIDTTNQGFLGTRGLNFLPENFVKDMGSNFRMPSNGVYTENFEEIYNKSANLPKWISSGDLQNIGSYWSGGEGTDAIGSWKFIISPESIQWSTSSNPSRLDMFGTNSPPVIHGAKGMRDLTLGKAIVEGFTRSKQVEDKVSQLEKLMNYELSSGNPFVNVPVYKVTANEKVYGDGVNSTDGGYFIIKQVSVDETMRDFTGRATRAVVDVELIQVPAYQVESGIDQASKSVSGATSILQEIGENAKAQNEKDLQERAVERSRGTTSGRTTSSQRGRFLAGSIKAKKDMGARYGFWRPTPNSNPIPATREQKLKATGSDKPYF